MREFGNGAGFVFETAAQVWLLREALRQDFDGDRAAEARIGGAIDFSHATGAQGGVDLEGTELCAGGDGHAGSKYNLRAKRGGAESLAQQLLLNR